MNSVLTLVMCIILTLFVGIGIAALGLPIIKAAVYKVRDLLNARNV